VVVWSTVSHGSEARRKHWLLIVTDIRVDVTDPRVPTRWLRIFGGLEQRFDVSWALGGAMIKERDEPGQRDARLVFVPPARSKWHFLLLFPRYLKTLRSAMGNADIVLVLAPMLTTLPALLAAKLSRRPSMLFVIAPMSAVTLFRGRFNGWMGRLFLNLEVLLATETLLLSSRLGEGILSPLGRRVEIQMLSSIDEEDLLPIAGSASDADVELLCVARLVSFKRIDIAIETVWRLRRDGVEATLTIVGDGEDRPRLERLTQTLGLSGVVEFIGWLDDPKELREYYRRAFALLLPSELEGFGMVTLEAMASGTPVVMTPTGGLDAFEPEVEVLVVPTGSAELFERAVKRLHSDHDFYLRLARAAQAKAQTLTRGAWQETFYERADRLIRERHS